MCDGYEFMMDSPYYEEVGALKRFFQEIKLYIPVVHCEKSIGENISRGGQTELIEEIKIMFQKIMVIGCPGSGKSTFSRNLRDITNLPLYYLDMIKHRPDRTEISSEEFDIKLKDILIKEQWIIDGNYQRTIETRLKECDMVFLFDLPTEVCLEGAKSRIGTKREDLPWVETEKDLKAGFQQCIEEFSTQVLPTIYQLLEKYNDKQIIIFKSREEADLYLAMIKQEFVR